MAKPLLRIQLPPMRCGEQSFPSGLRQELAITPQFAVVWLIHGAAEHLDGQGRRHHLAAGDAFHRFPEVVHSTDFAPGTRALYLALPAEAVGFMRSCGVGFLEQPVFRPGVHAELEARMHVLAETLRRAPAHGLALVGMQLVTVMAELHQRAGRSSGTRMAALMERAVEHLTDLEAAPLHQAALARSLGLPYRSFRRAFVCHIGCPPESYRIRARISAAQELLATTRDPIAAIARRLGYRDGADFARQFSRHCGRSPRAYRMLRLPP